MLSQLSYIPTGLPRTQCVTAKGTVGELLIFCQVTEADKG